MIYAPWTDDQVAALKRYQTNGRFHPYTCGNRGDHLRDKGGVLVPTKNGWRCPECQYVQNWAWNSAARGA